MMQNRFRLGQQRRQDNRLSPCTAPNSLICPRPGWWRSRLASLARKQAREKSHSAHLHIGNGSRHLIGSIQNSAFTYRTGTGPSPHHTVWYSWMLSGWHLDNVK
jgi:hypothetical protein